VAARIDPQAFLFDPPQELAQAFVGRTLC